MKRLLLLLVLVIVIFSCSEEFLIKEPYGVPAETVFTNEKGLDALLIGTYGIISGGALWEVSWGASVTNWLYGSAASDDAYKGSDWGDSSDIGQIEYWEVSPANSFSGQKWKWVFMGVTRANEVLRILRITEGLAPARAAEIAMKAVRFEHRLELATEGHRFFDLRRWSILVETLNDFAARDAEFRPQGYMDNARFTSRDRYMPIPQSQIDLQPGVLEQNPGY